MRKKLITLLCLFIFALMNNGFSSHIIGGGFSYRYLGNNLYEITLDYYRDCGPTSADFPPGGLKIGMFEKGSNSLIQELQLEIDTTYNVDFGANTCITSPVNCVQKRVYSAIQFLDALVLNNSLGYYFSYEQCCRNSGAINVVEPQNLGAVYYMEIPALSKMTVFQNNSSPAFQNYPALLLCNSELYEIPFPAIDPDGDSIVFSLVDPLKGHTDPATFTNQSGQAAPLPGDYIPVVWQSGYGIAANNLMDGNPDLRIDSSSGTLTVRPNRLGIFLAAIKCEEFRNGIKIGEVRRELELIVVDCPNRFFPTITLIDDPNSIKFKANEKKCFQILIEDENALDSLAIYIDQIDPGFNFGQITFSAVKGKSPQLLEFCFQPNCIIQEEDSISVVFACSDGSCPNPLKTTFSVKAPLFFSEKFDFEHEMPNVFTPNNDGLNDFFQFPSNFPRYCANNFQLQIFNRWGKRVFNSKEVSFKWNGDGAPAGVYFVSIQLGTESHNSTLNLVR